MDQDSETAVQDRADRRTSRRGAGTSCRDLSVGLRAHRRTWSGIAASPVSGRGSRAGRRTSCRMSPATPSRTPERMGVRGVSGLRRRSAARPRVAVAAPPGTVRATSSSRRIPRRQNWLLECTSPTDRRISSSRGSHLAQGDEPHGSTPGHALFPGVPQRSKSTRAAGSLARRAGARTGESRCRPSPVQPFLGGAGIVTALGRPSARATRQRLALTGPSGSAPRRASRTCPRPPGQAPDLAPPDLRLPAREHRRGRDLRRGDAPRRLGETLEIPAAKALQWLREHRGAVLPRPGAVLDRRRCTSQLRPDDARRPPQRLLAHVRHGSRRTLPPRWRGPARRRRSRGSRHRRRREHDVPREVVGAAPPGLARLSRTARTDRRERHRRRVPRHSCARRSRDMLNMRRRGGLLAREEFAQRRADELVRPHA